MHGHLNVRLSWVATTDLTVLDPDASYPDRPITRIGLALLVNSVLL